MADFIFRLDLKREKKETDGQDGVYIRKNENLAEQEGILHDQDILSRPSEDNILDWIEKLYRTSRGFEIGTFNPSLVATIIKKQSAKWAGLALGYISGIIAMIHYFIVKVLEKVCPDDRVRGNLLSILVDDLTDKYRDAVERVKFLLHVERIGTPMTLNEYLQENLDKNLEKRYVCLSSDRQDWLSGYFSRERNKHAAKENGTTQHEGNHSIETEKDNPMSSGKHTVQYIHDILHAYYEVASKRFVDNVCMQATDYHLVTRPFTPLKLFSPSLITGLNPEQLDNIAGEDPMVNRKRAQLKNAIEEIETGRKILL